MDMIHISTKIHDLNPHIFGDKKRCDIETLILVVFTKTCITFAYKFRLTLTLRSHEANSKFDVKK